MYDDQDEFTCGTIYLNNDLKLLYYEEVKDGNTFISKYNKDFPRNIVSI